ncbi:MAG: shikimate dehydrogenase [Planctomycetaceae bacterium]|nr:shikimate dehydrogenase [Planctomycetaceae bacterium]
MICVTLGRTRHSMMVAEHESLAENGAQLVELRLDWLKRMPELQRLLTERPTPVIVTCRRPEEVGKWRGTEEQRQTLLRQAIVLGAEYVDLEIDIAEQVPRYGETKRIISYHNFKETPVDLDDIYAAMEKQDADYLKLATMANTPEDNIRLLSLVAEAEIPTIAFCMGEMGVPSRILCGKYGSPWTYATFSSERVLAPGQLSFEDMRDIYHYDEVNEDTRVFGVLGDPVGHSYSPILHNAALRHEGINAVYLPLRVPSDVLLPTLKEFEKLDIEGYSVTIPHKEQVLEYTRYHHQSVEDCGAANTLHRNDRGKWFATNTDYPAALKALKEALKLKNPNDPQLAGKQVLMLGAGGVAKAIGLAVVRSGAGLTIANRSNKRGKALAEALNCHHTNWENRGSVHADILINCTPVGMFPNVDETPFAQNWLRDGMLVFDTIYNPENTLLLKEAREHECYTLSGLEMFVLQAAEQFDCFVHQPAPVDFMRETLRRAISPVRLN